MYSQETASKELSQDLEDTMMSKPVSASSTMRAAAVAGVAKALYSGRV